MYNRYVPQADGSYRRNRVPEPRPEPQRPPTPPEPPQPCIPETPTCAGCVHNQPPRRPLPPRQNRNTPPMGVGSFLKRLLPKDFDTEDLLIVLLLLLMAGDCQEDQNTALLTLVLYMFL